ncbi:MAG: sulfotransferase domain-containing protein, partial [Candidatus Limnocylindrales bacterium]
EFVQAATLTSMRARASDAAPDAHLGLWRSAEGFFRSGGTRDWAALLTPAEIEHFDQRLHDLAGGAYGWVMGGRRGLSVA